MSVTQAQPSLSLFIDPLFLQPIALAISSACSRSTASVRRKIALSIRKRGDNSLLDVLRQILDRVARRAFLHALDGASDSGFICRRTQPYSSNGHPYSFSMSSTLHATSYDY